MQETTARVQFDKKYLIALVLPLVIEQVLAVTVGMADMIMVSGAGDTAVSGVSLVNTISNLLIYIFNALDRWRSSSGTGVRCQEEKDWSDCC